MPLLAVRDLGAATLGQKYPEVREASFRSREILTTDGMVLWRREEVKAGVLHLGLQPSSAGTIHPA